jgi:hypothetical protein
MLTPYDEFPVHQASRPFSYIPSTDYNWDDGYYFGAFSEKHKIYLLTGMRVNPNTDMIGGYAIINVDGRQYNVRFSRCWRRQVDTVIGPLAYRFVEPLKTIRLTLDANDSKLSFDLTWSGRIPAFEEEHHQAENRGRLTTDQTRYSQVGVVSGVIRFDGETIDVNPEEWVGDRDHSWGLYAERPPLGPSKSLLPPAQNAGAKKRALRFWTPFLCGEYGGFYHFHETRTGEPCDSNNVFGSAFEGLIYQGWNETPIKLISGSHKLVFQENSRILKGGVITLKDEHGKTWEHAFEIPMMPWIVQPMGYTPGSWKDGGTMHTYHGSEELAIEWDEFDASVQPFPYTPYAPKDAAGATNAEVSNAFGLGIAGSNETHGIEYLASFTLTAPDGSHHKGQGHVEFFLDGPFDPYGFE